MKSVSCSYMIHPSWFTNGSWFTLAVVYTLSCDFFFCMEVWFLETSHNQTQELLVLSVSLMQETNQFPVVSVVWLLFTYWSSGYIYIPIPVPASLYIKTNVKIAQVFGGNLTEWKNLSTGGRRFKKWKPIAAAAAAGIFLVEMLPSSFAFFPAIPIGYRGKFGKHKSFLGGLYAG